MREDPRSAEIIKPYLRGQDVKRWLPEWKGLWMIFARRGIDIDAYPSVKRHLEQFRDRLEPKPKGWSGDRWSGRKSGSYRWYEIQDAIDYFEIFDDKNIFYQDLAFHSRFGFAEPGTVAEMTCFSLPTDDPWLLTVLNSPLMWAYMWRNVIHGKDEVLRLKNIYIKKLPIAPATNEAQDEAEEAVLRLIFLTSSGQEARRDTLDWLRVEFGIEKPGQKLEDFAALGPDAFVEEVRKRRPKGEGRLTPGPLRDLRDGYAEMANPVHRAKPEAASLERKLSELVNKAYGLTDEEVDLLRRTAPPRMPEYL